jgi:hypothetical protein
MLSYQFFSLFVTHYITLLCFLGGRSTFLFICVISKIPSMIYFAQVASWGAYLLSRNVIAMSFAPRDSHEAQVQFALERGVPAVIGVLGTIKLPYPSRAFDMAHCSRCLIPWGANGEDYIL